MMQYANVLKEKPLPVESIKMLVRAHNDREARVFTDMIYQVDLTRTISEADAESLARAASERCFVENTTRQGAADHHGSSFERKEDHKFYPE